MHQCQCWILTKWRLEAAVRKHKCAMERRFTSLPQCHLKAIRTSDFRASTLLVPYREWIAELRKQVKQQLRSDVRRSSVCATRQVGLFILLRRQDLLYVLPVSELCKSGGITSEINKHTNLKDPDSKHDELFCQTCRGHSTLLHNWCVQGD